MKLTGKALAGATVLAALPELPSGGPSNSVQASTRPSPGIPPGAGLNPKETPDPEGKVADRYDKCFCTGGDQKHYSAGDRLVTRDLPGVRVGLAICYDLC